MRHKSAYVTGLQVVTNMVCRCILEHFLGIARPLSREACTIGQFVAVLGPFCVFTKILGRKNAILP